MKHENGICLALGIPLELSKIFIPVLPPPPVLEKLPQESSCRLELCMLLLCGSLCAQDTQCWAGCELEQPEVGRGRRAAGQAWLGCLPPISEEAHFADVLGVGQEVC